MGAPFDLHPIFVGVAASGYFRRFNRPWHAVASANFRMVVACRGSALWAAPGNGLPTGQANRIPEGGLGGVRRVGPFDGDCSSVRRLTRAYCDWGLCRGYQRARVAT